jgi:hypothetical protein
MRYHAYTVYQAINQHSLAVLKSNAKYITVITGIQTTLSVPFVFLSLSCLHADQDQPGLRSAAFEALHQHKSPKTLTYPKYSS